MLFPNPLPDNPKKWDGWRNYDSDNYYARLCLRYEDGPGPDEIESHCRQLLIWWQKKLPLKNQPSNPIAAMLRSGLDDAARLISQARAELLNPMSRARFDAVLRARVKERAHEEFHKYLSFSLADSVLSKEAESRLMKLGTEHNLSEDEVVALIDHQLELAGATRQPEEKAPASSGMSQGPTDPKQEFIRLLNLSGLDGDEMTDDQRDAFINMAENLGLDPGDAEDIVDEWMEDQTMAMIQSMSKSTKAKVSIQSPAKKPATQPIPQKTAATPAAPATPTLSPEEEARQFPTFCNSFDMDMILIPSSTFRMGAIGLGAAPNERPVHQVSVGRYHISRHLITNALYEKFAPGHMAKRPPWSKDDHPVVNISCNEAIQFCNWLSGRDGKQYRLPTEAEWELAARGTDGRPFPWGNQRQDGCFANFADVNSRFAWSDANVNDGFAETSPIGSYPDGASPFGVCDMAGNVWEWCSDYYDLYPEDNLINPGGPPSGTKKVMRGGSWRSRMASLRTTTRGFNALGATVYDLGFRVVSQC